MSYEVVMTITFDMDVRAYQDPDIRGQKAGEQIVKMLNNHYSSLSNIQVSDVVVTQKIESKDLIVQFEYGAEL